MACFQPLTAYTKPGVNGKKQILFGVKHTHLEKINLPCGQCIGCRVTKSRDWAIRCVHEMEQHEENSFITLTYENHNLPPDGNLYKPDFQRFIKSLRKRTGKKIRYYMCGEYGENNLRPHYHAILFGYAPTELITHKEYAAISSAEIDKAWKLGFNRVGEATYESARYIASYIHKKINGNKALEHYMTEEGVSLIPEYTNMSLKPGIGANYYEKNSKEIFVTDSVVLKGQEMPPPKYYSNKYELDNPAHMAEIKEQRRQNIDPTNNTPERLATRKTVAIARHSRTQRNMENS